MEEKVKDTGRWLHEVGRGSNGGGDRDEETGRNKASSLHDMAAYTLE